MNVINISQDSLDEFDWNDTENVGKEIILTGSDVFAVMFKNADTDLKVTAVATGTGDRPGATASLSLHIDDTDYPASDSSFVSYNLQIEKNVVVVKNVPLVVSINVTNSSATETRHTLTIRAKKHQKGSLQINRIARP